MSKAKTRTVDMSVSEADLDKIILPEEAAQIERDRFKELKYQEKLAKKAKKTEKATEKQDLQAKIEAKAEAVKAKPKIARLKPRSRRYQAARRLVDRTKVYPLKVAADLVIKTNYTAFPGTIVAELVVKKANLTATITFPHPTGRIVKVAVASDALLKEIETGQLNFDILLTKPEFMPKIAKLAKILGPKGLMPNPKNQTIVADPEKRQAELEAGTLSVRTEKKAPLLHVVIGKTNHQPAQLMANVEALIKAVDPRQLIKLTLAATMSPGIKVDLTPYQAL
ncbi:hypothetical protein A2W24_04965 [Microgenomates group bacterium RBG_16_45_19]|nr:MAG: hypothetical protein A2W24_04965 [Microgenomates group bacterium RBG_16_45_19]